jgi:carbon-monoxide dehydrogenase large subunit
MSAFAASTTGGSQTARSPGVVDAPTAPPEGERYVGRAVPRVEDRRLLTGTGAYVADMDLDGQLHMRVVRSELAHAAVHSVDTAAARQREGVIGVFTAGDVPDVRIPVRLLPTEAAEGALQSVLARDRVRYVGEPIAVVIARDPYTAEDGVRDVRVDLDPLEPIVDPLAAREAGSVVLHPGIGTNLLKPFSVAWGADVDALIESAHVVVEDTFHVGRHGAVPMEPRGLLARYEADKPLLSVWGVAKVKHFNRRILASLLDMPVEEIRFVEMDVGGGFGARGEFYPEDFLVPWAAMQLGAPVKWVEDRRENLVALNQSREQVWTLQVAADEDGKLLALRASGLFNQGAYVRTHGAALFPRLMINHLPGPYRWEAYEIEAVPVLTNKTPAGTYRGPGQYEPTFVRERALDMVARELGVDPVELRRSNLVTTGNYPYDSGLVDLQSGRPVVYDDGDFPETLERLLAHVGYSKLRVDVTARQAAGELVGLGVAVFVEMGTPGLFEQSRVVAESDGGFTVHVGIASLGQGIETVLTQIAADQLQVPVERIQMSYRDTDIIPEGLGAFSSRGTVFGGNAIVGAVQDLKKRALAAADDALDARHAAKDMRYAGGAIRWDSEGEERKLTLAELGVEGSYRYEPGGGSHTAMGANLGVVSVDPDSGRVKVLQYAVSYELGRAINPQTVRGQIRGAAAQGVAGALFEEFAYTLEGQPLSTTFMDYVMPTAAEIPDIDVILVELGEKASRESPLAGVKGAGEGGIVGTGPTVANAVADAIGPLGGRQLVRLPITPEAVVRLCGAPREQPRSA